MISVFHGFSFQFKGGVIIQSPEETQHTTKTCSRISIYIEHVLGYSYTERICCGMSRMRGREHVSGYSYIERICSRVSIMPKGVARQNKTSPRKLALSIQWLSNNVVE